MFTDLPLPLAIGIHHNVAGLLGGEAAPATIKRFLRRWTKSRAYISAVAAGGPRYDLGGRPVGEVTAKQRERAASLLARHCAA